MYRRRLGKSFGLNIVKTARINKIEQNKTANKEKFVKVRPKKSKTLNKKIKGVISNCSRGENIEFKLVYLKRLGRKY
jgi:hypothetical protein